jgi:hypothetical protein
MKYALLPLAEKLSERFAPEPNSGCWLWLGVLNRGGYGMVKHLGVYRMAHRESFLKHRGPIPGGLELDHLCRTRACVNPDHLEPVTHKENIRRGSRAMVTHCPSGHPYSPDNTYRDARGSRFCRSCKRASAARNYQKRKVHA